MSDPDATAAEKVERHLQRMRARAGDAKLKAADREADRALLKSLENELRAEDAQTRAQFAEVDAHLREHALPEEIRQRHREAMEQFEHAAASVGQDLSAVSEAPDASALQARLEKLKARAEVLRTQRRHQALEPGKLPFERARTRNRPPRTKPQEFAALVKRPLSEQRLWASTSAIAIAAAAAAAGPADLAGTEDAQITPAIQALAAQLHHNPIEIYNWVYHNIIYVPSYGSIQGSVGVLQTRRGNAFDTASLQIALLRASNIPARYVLGTVEIPIEKVMNWVGGVESPQAALDLLSQGGIPVIGAARGGRIVAARMEHVWVEAFVDFAPSRGAVNLTPDSWIPMDASYKQYVYSNAIDPGRTLPVTSLDSLTALQSQLQLDPATGRIAGLTLANTRAVLDEARAAVEAYFDQAIANEQGLVREIQVDMRLLPVLPAALPYHVVAAAPGIAELANATRRAFQFNLYRSVADQAADNAALSFRRNLTQLAGKRLSVAFQPATPADLEALSSFLPQPGPDGAIDPATLARTIPGYLIHLNAALLLDGAEVARANDFVLGQEIATTLQIQRLTGEWYSANNVNTAGEYLAISLDLQGVGGDLYDKVSAQTPENLLHQAGRGYWSNLDEHLQMLGSLHMAIGVRQPSFGIFSTLLQPTYRYGVPTNVVLAGVSVDIDASFTSMMAFDGNANRTREAASQNGVVASQLEHEIPQVYLAEDGNEVRGVSAIAAIAEAVAENQPLFRVTASSLSAVLPLLQQAPEIITDVQRAVANGYEVLISQAPVTIDGWRGTGYIIEDPETGSGAYRISGGLNGGRADPDLAIGLTMLGLGALGLIFIPLAAADKGDCGQKERQQISWKEILAAAIIAAMIVLLLSASGGTLAPAAAKAIAVVLGAFAPIAAALASPAEPGDTCATFYLGTTAVTGSTVEVNTHVSSAIASGKKDKLTFVGPNADLEDRVWYRRTPECNDKAKDAYEIARGSRGACDEYPFFATWEGGFPNYVKGDVSLRLLDFSDNSTAGTVFRWFTYNCRIGKNEQFKVVPIVGVTRGEDKKRRVCYVTGGIP